MRKILEMKRRDGHEKRKERKKRKTKRREEDRERETLSSYMLQTRYQFFFVGIVD